MLDSRTSQKQKSLELPSSFCARGDAVRSHLEKHQIQGEKLVRHASWPAFFERGGGGGGFAKFGIATEVRQLPAENHRCLD